MAGFSPPTSPQSVPGFESASDIIAKEIHRIVDECGVESIYAQADGHGEAKMLHGTHGCQTRLLSRIGTGNHAFQYRQADSRESWHWDAKHIWGMDPFGNTGKQTNLAKDVAENADALLFESHRVSIQSALSTTR